MNREPGEGLVIQVRPCEAQNGVVHAEPCDCTTYLQIGAGEQEILHRIEELLGTLAQAHNAISVACKECQWEGYIGPGPKAASEGNKAVVDEGSCPHCDGDLFSMERAECTHEKPSLEPYHDEQDITDDE